MQALVVCPKCSNQFSLNVNPPQWRFEGPCPKCQRAFRCEFYTIRAKRSRGYRRTFSREFHVRVVDGSGTEHLIEFVNRAFADFELRQGDEAIFIYYRDQLRLIQNLTIRQYFVVRNSLCFVASCAFGEDSYEVQTLRTLRDSYLRPFKPFAILVFGYEAISPVLVQWWGQSPVFRRLARILIFPIIHAFVILTGNGRPSD
jgi:hypothetical protein